jgi:MFS family permease
MYDALQALFIARTLGLPPVVFGLLFTVGSLSGLFGAVFAAPLMRRIGPGPAILATALLISAGWLTMPLAFGAPGVVIAILVGGGAVRGLGNTLYNIGATSVRQAFVPDELLGRVNSAGLFLAWGLLPIGALVGGFLGAAVGIRETLLAGSILRIVLLLGLCAAPLLALRAMPAAELSSEGMAR